MHQKTFSRENSSISISGISGSSEAGLWSIDQGRGPIEISPFPIGLYIGMILGRDSQKKNFSHLVLGPLAAVLLFLDGMVEFKRAEMGASILKNISFKTTVGEMVCDVAISKEFKGLCVATLSKNGAILTSLSKNCEEKLLVA